jgi:signal peptide peptidase SppA
MRLEGDTAVIPVSGVLLKRRPAWAAQYRAGITGYDEIAQAFNEAAANPAVKQIRLAITSPGGTVAGVEDAAAAIRAAAAVKPVIAVVDDLCASGAYWLASQARDIVANSTAEIGSIGVYVVIADYSAQAEGEGVKVNVIASGEHKGTGVPGAPISEEQLRPIRDNVNTLAERFRAAVVNGRGRMPEEVFTGRLYLAEAAERLGLIDAVLPPDIAHQRPPVPAVRALKVKEQIPIALVRTGTACGAPIAEIVDCPHCGADHPIPWAFEDRKILCPTTKQPVKPEAEAPAKEIKTMPNYDTGTASQRWHELVAAVQAARKCSKLEAMRIAAANNIEAHRAFVREAAARNPRRRAS